MQHASRRRPYRRVLAAGLIALPLVLAGVWWYRMRAGAATPVLKDGAAAPSAASASGPGDDAKAAARPERVVLAASATSAPAPPPSLEFTAAADAAPDDQVQSAAPPAATQASTAPRSASPVLDEARRLLETGKFIEARDGLSTALRAGAGTSDEREVRALLTRIADETVFSRRTIPNDPLVESYTVAPGDVLVNIGKKYDVPPEVLMLVNGIKDPRTIRADQKLKVPKGPFHAKISKSQFRLDVYLGEVYLRSFRVGLGAENGTPEGVWKVKERLVNPTYYPSASAADKRIIEPDDPNNPLGEHWIGLQGVEGPAVGHEGYGIHGTIEPDSVGRAVSLGCIRMLNEDVAFLYGLLLPGRSTVTIGP